MIWGLLGSPKHDRWLTIALGLILGGTLGNLFDRIVFGGVRDFLYFYLINWPVFNIADCCLVVGAGLLLIQALFTKPKETTPASDATRCLISVFASFWERADGRSSLSGSGCGGVVSSRTTGCSASLQIEIESLRGHRNQRDHERSLGPPLQLNAILEVADRQFIPCF